MRLLLTRPLEDARSLARRLRRGGHQVDLAPILTMRYCPEACPDKVRPAALAVTSKNGIRALLALPQKRLKPLLRLPLYAVGEQTAAAARRAGWHCVIAAQGSVADLAHRIIASFPKGLSAAQRPIWHISGAVQAGALVETLRQAGLAAERVVLYQAEPVTHWPRHVARQFPNYEGVIIYSTRSAQLFCGLVPERDAQMQPYPHAYCLSEAVAQAMAAKGFVTAVADAPSDDAMIALINAATL